jgi:hypothetical protein
MNSNKISQIIRALDEGTFGERSKAMQEVCPCRNDVQDRYVWNRVFQAAYEPGKVRVRAIHAIATLLQRSKSSGRWRAVLKDFEDELDGVLSDPEACRLLRRQVQHDPKAEGDLTPAAQCKKLRQIVAMNTPAEVADWLNQLLGHEPAKGINPGQPGLMRLWRWHQHRITIQPLRRTDAGEFLKKAEQWLPDYFRDTTVDLGKLEVSHSRPKTRPEVAPPYETPNGELLKKALGWLESTNAKRRVRGLKRLAELKVSDLLDWCLMFLEDESRDVRVAALQGMIHCDEINRTVLAPLAESEDVRIRASALAVLARHGGEGAARWFELGLKDPSACVRLETAALLGRLDQEANHSLFEIALHDPNPSVVRYARKAIA